MGWGSLLAFVMLTNPAAAIGIISPTFVDGFVAGGLPLAWASRMAAAEFFAIAGVMLCAPLFITRIDRRLTGAVGIIVAAIAQLLSLQTDSLGVAILCRAAAGAGEGALSAVAIASLAASPNPDRAFGIAVSSNKVAGTLLLALIAWAADLWPASGAVVVAAIFIAANILFVPALPAQPAKKIQAPSSQHIGRHYSAAFGIGGMFLLAIGFGVVWPLTGQIGTASGVSPSTLAFAYSIVGFGGIAGGAAAATLAIRLGRLVPLVFGTLSMALCLALIPTALFAPAVVMTLFFWAFNIPYYVGLQALFDPSGRLAVLTSAMIPFGIAGGQIIAGQIAMHFAIATVTIVGGAALILSLLLMLNALRLTRGAAVTAAPASS